MAQGRLKGFLADPKEWGGALLADIAQRRISTRRTVAGLFTERSLPLQKALFSAAPASREWPPDFPANIPNPTVVTTMCNPLNCATLEARTDASAKLDREFWGGGKGSF